jgi:hypothetical protein
MSRELLEEQQWDAFQMLFWHKNSKDCNDSKMGYNKELVCTM